MKKNTFIEMVGGIGTLLVLTAYALLNMGLIIANSFLYQSFNLIGALSIVYVSYKKGAKQPLWLNVIWALIAIYALGRLFI